MSSKGPRTLSQSDVDGFFSSAGKRVTPLKSAEIAHKLRQDNPVRWWRLQKDIKHYRKLMIKMGLNPEDWRLYI